MTPATTDEDDPDDRLPLTTRQRVVRVTGTLILGSFGGALFYLLKMPLPWMIGALIITTVTALVGVPLERSQRLRMVMVPVLGVMLGASFTPDALAHAGHWVVSLGSLLVFALTITTLVAFYLARVVGWDPATSYFSASPGGFGAMVLLGEAMGADERRISLNHSVRILITALTIPFWFRFFQGYQPGNMTMLGTVTDFALRDAVILLACAVIGLLVAKRLRLPAEALLGPALLSAAVHLAGVTQARPPQEVVAVAQIVIGSAIGCRFVGVSVVRVSRILLRAVAITVVMLGSALAIAGTLAEATDLSFLALCLAFAPGGLAEMTLISLSLGIDTVFVSSHHIVRVLFLVTMAPLMFRLLRGPLGDEERETDAA